LPITVAKAQKLVKPKIVLSHATVLPNLEGMEMSSRQQPEALVHGTSFRPGAETGWRRHMADYVVVPLLDGDLLLEEPRGGARTIRLKWHVPYAKQPTSACGAPL
jgi:hypothetical protein